MLFDQRGCGRSTPHAELRENTTWELVADIERLREHLGIDRWFVFGGSWGSTLALAYAEAHPERCLGLVLRGIFLLRRKELLWFYQEGASWLFPEAWEEYLDPIPEAERGDLMAAYYKRLTSPDAAVRLRAARAWSIWEGSTSKLRPDPKLIERFAGDTFAEAFARIECHYFVNGAFLSSDTQLLDEATKIAHLPGVIVQGRYDVVCPARSAFDLHRRWPKSKLVMVGDAGHSISEPGIVVGPGGGHRPLRGQLRAPRRARPEPHPGEEPPRRFHRPRLWTMIGHSGDPMVHPDLLEILACPEDKTPVRLMEATALAALNERIGKGGVKTRGASR